MKRYYGIYRGIIKFNSYGTGLLGQAVPDSQLRGKCKIYIPGVYPDEWEDLASKLPWAEPAYGLFGNDATTQGINSVPAVGTFVWIFFEEGDYRYPKYFLVCQGGSGWVSEHVKQHTLNTEKVSIVVDDSPADGSKNAVLNITVTNPNDEAIEINVNGNVVLNITGNVTQTITGDVSETITGKVTKTITGDVSETITGNVTRRVTGSVNNNVIGNVADVTVGTKSITSTGPLTITGNPTTIN